MLKGKNIFLIFGLIFAFAFASVNTACSYTFTDSNVVDGDHGYYEQKIYTYCKAGEALSVTFTEMDLELDDREDGCYNYLLIFDGDWIDAPQITTGSFNGAYCGEEVSEFLASGNLTSTNDQGCLTFFFVSDEDEIDSGWSADITCIDAPETPNVLPERTSQCGTTIKDDGGDGDYTPNSVQLFGFCESDTKVQLDLNIFDIKNYLGYECKDYIKIFSGDSLNDRDLTILYTEKSMDQTKYCGTDVQEIFQTEKEGGCLYLLFKAASHKRPEAGYEATVQCPPTTTETPTAEFSPCGHNFTDTGGVDGRYGNWEGKIWNFCEAGKQLTATFTKFRTEDCYDFMRIFDGKSMGAPMFIADSDDETGKYCYDDSDDFVPEFLANGVTSTNEDGCLTFFFTSDYSYNYLGWEAEITCQDFAEPPNQEVINNPCGAEFSDGSGDGDYERKLDLFWGFCNKEGLFVDLEIESIYYDEGDNICENDWLKIFDGNKILPFSKNYVGDGICTNSPISMTITPTNSDGCLNFAFHSDSTNHENSEGFKGVVTCVGTTPVHAFIAGELIEVVESHGFLVPRSETAMGTFYVNRNGDKVSFVAVGKHLVCKLARCEFDHDDFEFTFQVVATEGDYDFGFLQKDAQKWVSYDAGKFYLDKKNKATIFRLLRN